MNRMLRHLALYTGIVGSALLLLVLILRHGPSARGGVGAAVAADPDWAGHLFSELSRNLNLPMATLLIQILVVLSFSRVVAALFKRLGQTEVIGEIVAGILLGKSVFALLWPAGFDYVFPESSMPRLYFLSQFGLILFMFVVGLELNVETIKKRASAAVLVSHGSIVLPFVLGAGLSVFLYRDYAPLGIAFSSFALFMGIAMSVTAFPVLARIIKEKALTQSPLGSMALTCAAVDDVTAWCILAAVIGIVKAGSMASAAVVLSLSVVYVLIMIKAIRPFIERRLRPRIDGSFRRDQFAWVFIVVLGSALIAEAIGIHALFGAFLAGTVMPKSLSFRANVIRRVEDLSSVTLLPLFFAFTGIRTQIGLLSTPRAWAVCAIVIGVAVVGKVTGGAGAARLSGMSWRESLSIGALMNTRGLMELVVLNIGYDLGILSPAIFSMMVVMAVVTTMMTGPLLNLLIPEGFRAQGAELVV